MKQLRCVIIDDETKSTEVLLYLIERHCSELNILRTFCQPKKALEYLSEHSSEIDLLLLDINMPQMSGFDLLDRLNTIPFDVVFITAHDEYALKAFKYYAIDYIMKPVDITELQNLINRLYRSQGPKYDKNDFELLFNQLSKTSPSIKQLAIPTQSGVAFLQFDDILRLQADSNYTYIIKTDKTKLYSAKTLKYFENLLPSEQFFRPHQSHIINVGYMEEFVRSDGGYIRMKDTTEVALARSKRQEFLSRFL